MIQMICDVTYGVNFSTKVMALLVLKMRLYVLLPPNGFRKIASILVHIYFFHYHRISADSDQILCNSDLIIEQFG
jgi:hypothetical protein